MGLLFRNWAENGFYEEDSRGDLTRIEDAADIIRAQKEGRLYEHDDAGMTKVEIDATIRKK